MEKVFYDQGEIKKQVNPLNFAGGQYVWMTTDEISAWQAMKSGSDTKKRKATDQIKGWGKAPAKTNWP